MIVIDMDMPENCVECHEKGIQELLECRLIFSGCANCGRHPNCPIKCDIEQIRDEIEQLTSRYSISKERGGMGQVEWSDRLIKESDVLQIIDKYR